MEQNVCGNWAMVKRSSLYFVTAVPEGEKKGSETAVFEKPIGSLPGNREVVS